MMSDNDRALIREFLEDLAERISCAGCNDYELDDTPENRELYAAAYADDGPEMPLRIINGKIACSDFVIVHELIRRLT